MSPFPLGALIVAVAGVAVLAIDQARRGRLRRRRRVAVDQAAFERLVLSAPPEVIGAAWDDTVGRDDLKAILARFLVEGRISAWIEGTGMVLKLEGPRSSFELPQERALVDALFVSGDSVGRKQLARVRGRRRRLDPEGSYDVTDIPEILGVEPAELEVLDGFRDELLTQARELHGGPRPDRKALPERPELFASVTDPGGKETAAEPRGGAVPDRVRWIYLLCLLLTLRGINPNKELDPGLRQHWSTFPLILVATLGHFGAMAAAEAGRRRATVSLAAISLPVVPLLAAPFLAPFLGASEFTAAWLAFLFLLSLGNVLFRMRSTDDARQGAKREELAAAREYLRSRLPGGVPDAWVPYAVAFGLGSQVRSSPEAFQPCGGVAAWTELVSSLVAEME